MAPVDLKDLSSNWKKLQQTLQQRQDGESKSVEPNPLKRKSGSEAGPPRNQNGVKRVKKDTDASIAAEKKRPRYSVKPKTMNNRPSSPANTLPSASFTIPPTLDPNGLNPNARPGKYISIDCEMVGTGPPPTHQPSILARVSIVTYHSQILYDTYVLPYPASTRITDYRTSISGITPFHISPSNPSARPFPLVQRTVAELLHGRILVGHALKHDLEVLGLKHPRRDVRDTARYPEWRKLYAGGRTPALRKLAREVLGWDIQGGEHSSVEDARAAMELWKGERKGFEREHVRVWGVDRRVVVKGKMVDGRVKGRGLGGKAVNGHLANGHEDRGSDDDDEEDEDILDEEDDEEVSLSDELDGEAMGVKSSQANGATQKKKKKKRKKRTKR